MLPQVRKGNTTGIGEKLFNDFFNDDQFGIDLWGGRKPSLFNRLGNDVVRGDNVNIIENDNDYQFEFFYPGMSKEDFNLTVEDGYLHLRVDKEENEEDSKNYIYKGYAKVSHDKSYAIPQDAKSDQIDAKYEDGVLRVIIPRDPDNSQNKKKIEIT